MNMAGRILSRRLTHHQVSRRHLTTSVYGWGETQALPLTGQLPHHFATPTPLSTRPDYAIPNEEITHLAAGWGHSLLGNARNVYGFGINQSGQLGCPHGGKVMACKEPLRQLACGREHSHIVTETGLYSFGSSMYGQLGIGKSKDTHPGTRVVQSEPKKVTDYSGRVVDIACGLDHTIFATDHPTMYGMGWGADGQLGLGASWTGDKNKPTELQLPGGRVKKLAGSTDFTLALMEDGTLWTWGNSEYGQGMTGAKVDRILEPVQVLANGVVDIAAGGPFSVILTEDGRVHTCGYGALGLGPDTIETLVLAQVEGLKEVTRVYASTDYAAATTGTGQLFTWGLNGPSARLGLGNTDHAFRPQQVQIDSAVQDVALGVSHALAICVD